MKCNYCGKEFVEPGYVLKYKDELYCDTRCLGDELVDELDDEIESEWIDTLENIEQCEKERRREW